MSDELWHNHAVSLTVYAIRFTRAGKVFITSGASSETWGAGGNDAGAYDVAMTETTVGSSGHYIGDFDASGNITAGTYRITIYKQAGASPADTDLPIGQAEISWSGTQEITLGSVDSSHRIKNEVYDETPAPERPQVTVK